MTSLPIYHIVYQTTNTFNGKVYVGVHSTSDLDGDYLGSGSALRLAVKRHGRHNFKREILSTHDTRDAALAAERDLVDEAFILREDTYNIVLGGGSPPNMKGSKVSDSSKYTKENRRRWQSPEYRAKMSSAFKTSKTHNKVPWSESRRQNSSKAKLGKARPQEVRERIKSSQRKEYTFTRGDEQFVGTHEEFGAVIGKAKGTVIQCFFKYGACDGWSRQPA